MLQIKDVFYKLTMIDRNTAKPITFLMILLSGELMIRVQIYALTIKIQKCRKFFHFFLMQKLALFLVTSRIGENTQKQQPSMPLQCMNG